MEDDIIAFCSRCGAVVDVVSKAERVCVGSEHALILNLLIKWACQVGVRPFSACTGPSKQHIPTIDELVPHPALTRSGENH